MRSAKGAEEEHTRQRIARRHIVEDAKCLVMSSAAAETGQIKDSKNPEEVNRSQEVKRPIE